MLHQNTDFQQRHTRAISYCHEYIQWYEQTKRTHRRIYQSLQVAAAALGIVTPLVAFLAKTRSASACSAAALGFVTSLDHIFQPKDTYIRFAHISELLKDELLKYETRTTERYALALDDQEALDNFVRAMSVITTTEVSQWRAQRQ